jgi:hypothetical protein
VALFAAGTKQSLTGGIFVAGCGGGAGERDAFRLLARRADFWEGSAAEAHRVDCLSPAYRHDQDRKDLQHFIGQSPWDHRPLLQELARQVGQKLGGMDENPYESTTAGNRGGTPGRARWSSGEIVGAVLIAAMICGVLYALLMPAC